MLVSAPTEDQQRPLKGALLFWILACDDDVGVRINEYSGKPAPDNVMLQCADLAGINTRLFAPAYTIAAAGALAD